MAGKKDKLNRADIKKLTDEQLGAEVKDLRGKLFTLRSQMVTEKVENLSQFKIIRRSIARLLTEATARQHAKNPARAKPAAAPVAPAPRKSIKMTAKRPGGAKAHKPKRPAPVKAAK